MTITLNEKIKIMQHYANGGEIEWKYVSCADFKGLVWEDCKVPKWNWSDAEYRIKVNKPKINWESIDSRWNYCVVIDNEVYFTELKPKYTNLWNIHGDYRRTNGVFKVEPNLKSKDSLVSRNGD